MREAPTNVRSLRDRIQNHADKKGVPFGRLQRSIAVALVGEVLRRAAGSEMAIKGGTSLELRLGTACSRASKDLDAVIADDFNSFFERLQLNLREGWQGFTGVATKPETIDVPTLADRPCRFNARLSYRGKSFATVPVEIALAELDAIATADLVPGPDLTQLGIAAIEPLPCLSIDHQAAQKLHACTQPDGDGFVNDRARDLVDLQLLEKDIQERLSNTARVCRRIFGARATHPWPPRVTSRANWDRIYAEASGDVEVAAPTVEEAIRAVQRIVDDLNGALE